MNGSLSSAKAKNFVVSLSKCHGEDYCKSEKEIDDFMKRKYMILLKNRIRFDSS